jgi:uncharacterized membrane protein
MVAAILSPLAVFVLVPVSPIYGLIDGERYSLHDIARSSFSLALTLLPQIYFMMFLVGVPAALLARRYNFTSVWFAAATGFVCPWIGASIMFALLESRSFALRFGTWAKWAHDFYDTLFFARSLLIPLSGLGFVIGTVFWFIAIRLINFEEA